MGNRKCFLSLRKLTQISVEERRQQTQKYIKKGFPALFYKETITDYKQETDTNNIPPPKTIHTPEARYRGKVY